MFKEKLFVTFKMKFTWIVTGLAFVLSPVFANLTPEQEARIDAIASEFRATNSVPGLGLAIVDLNKGTEWAKGYGHRDLENDIPVNNVTKFFIASVTKTFTATLVVKVLSENFPEYGANVMDMPIRSLIPSANFTLSDRYRSESASFRDLLSHRSCLQTDRLAVVSGSYANANEMVYRTRYAEEGCPFRVSGIYSNGLYALTGKLISQVAGVSYEELLGDLLAQIGMSDTSITTRDEDYDTFPQMTKGYYRKDGEFGKYNPRLYNRIFVSLPGGGLISTPSDMIKYMKFHLNMGTVGSTVIVPRNVMEWLYVPSLQVPFSSKKSNEGDLFMGQLMLATGFSISIYDGYYVCTHSGDWSPFLTHMAIHPHLNIGIYTVFNGPGFTEDPFALDVLNGNILDALLDNTRPKIPSKPLLNPEFKLSEKWMKKSSLNLLKRHVKNFSPALFAVGNYGHPVEGQLSITEPTPGQLYLLYGQWFTGNLVAMPEFPGIYVIDFDTDIRHQLYAIGGTDIDIYMDLSEQDVVTIIAADNVIPFMRNVSLETLPEIPWEADSCAPTQIQN